MSHMVEIQVVVPKTLKIRVPQQLFEELQQVVSEENISDIVTEALADELKKVRFRLELQRVNARVA